VKPQTHKQDSRVIVYDADRIQQPGTLLFDADAWAQKGAITGMAQGRGNALMLETEFGSAVLRHYLRGGWVGRFNRDRYLYTGFEKSRPLAEFRVLAELYQSGLPVPRPLAAQCVRDGLFYRGDLLTQRIPGATPLADMADDILSSEHLWQATGACIRTFHDHGVAHADLNARNILIDKSNTVFLIDFDRARVQVGASGFFQANLKRLHRSLAKFFNPEQLLRGWAQLLQGYNESSLSDSRPVGDKDNSAGEGE